MHTLPTLPVSESKMSPSESLQCSGIFFGISTIQLTLSPSNCPSLTFLMVTILYVPSSLNSALLKAQPLNKSIFELIVSSVHPSGTPSTTFTSSYPGKRKSTNHSLYRRCAASSSSFICFWLFSIKSSKASK